MNFLESLSSWSFSREVAPRIEKVSSAKEFLILQKPSDNGKAWKLEITELDKKTEKDFMVETLRFRIAPIQILSID